MEKTMEKIVALAKARGFVYPGSEIYGGLSNTWDFGPLGIEFKDNVKAHILQPDGTYVKPDKRGKAQINSQMEFCIEATEKAALHKHEEKKSRVFIPAEPAEDIEE